MYVALTRSILVCALLVVFSASNFLISTAWSAEMASQKDRFAGMGATFKEKKKEAADKQAALDAKEAAEKKAEEEQKEEQKAEALTSYFRLHTFVVNVIDEQNVDKILLLTLEVFCEIKDPDDRWLIDEHLAPIKDSIITYISGIKRQEIQTQKQKKALQKELTLRVSAVLKKLTGQDLISNLYLTRIIIQ